MSTIPTPPDDQPRPSRTGRFQFRLSTLFLLMLAVSVVSAAAAGLLRQGIATPSTSGALHLVMLVAAPLGLMIVLSVYYAVLRWWDRDHPPNDREPPEAP